MAFSSGWPETGCGIGSTLARTENIRSEIPKLVKELGVKTVLDAPCGDFNWMSRCDLGAGYIGCDFDEKHLEIARTREASFPATFIQIDVVHDPLPEADLMICREFLQHISNEDIAFTLKNSMSCKWLLATSYRNAVNEELVRPGFRRVNLMAEPWCFPEPERVIEDGEDHFLGLWRA